MNKKLLTSVAVGLVLLLAAVAQADVKPTMSWKDYRGTAYINGHRAPVGSIIDAYDPQGVHCGTFTLGSVTSNPGTYGSLPVYGDDTYGANAGLVDEGCVSGDVVTFKINGVVAGATIVDTLNPPHGYRLPWYDKEIARADLSVSGITVDMSLVDDPADRYALPGSTIRIEVGVRNDGNMMDFYSLTAVSDLGWTVEPKPELTYADPNETVHVYFDVTIPVWPGDDPDFIDFEVYSHLDPTVKVEGTVRVTASLDEFYDIALVDPPDDETDVPGSTVRFFVGVRNDGNVDDDFGIEAVSDLGWPVTPQAALVGATPGQTVNLYFDVTIPFGTADNEVSTIAYTVTSDGDPAVFVDGEVDLTCDAGTDVDDDIDGMLPDHLVLTQNYPNPFNPTTTFEFALPQSSRVEVQIINVLGQTVDRIDMGQVSSGAHSVEYNASALSSGVYFYRLQTDFGAETRKMVLLK